MEFPADLRLPLRSLRPFAGSSSKTRAIRSIFRFSPPKFASTKLSPPPQKAAGPDPIGTRSFFATNLWFFQLSILRQRATNIQKRMISSYAGNGPPTVVFGGSGGVNGADGAPGAITG